MNQSEELVSNLCEKSFFSLWSYPNPQHKKKKELCDVLVIFDPYVIIISVKDIKFNEERDLETSSKRWNKEAITKSAAQIYGAEKWILGAKRVIKKDGTHSINFPKDIKIIRICIAFGSEGKVPIISGYFDKGFVHVFDEISLQKIMNELDTISDFMEYLIKKEEFVLNDVKLIIEGGEEDLLAYYISNNRKFPKDADSIIITQGLWNEFEESLVYLDREKEDEISYAWDKIISDLCYWFDNDELITEHDIIEFETAIRTMAKENRFNRRILSKIFGKMLYKKIRARLTHSSSGVTYVFQANNPEIEREERKGELYLRCIVARGIEIKNQTVIGIATEIRESPDDLVSYDIVHYTLDDWNDKMQNTANKIIEEFGYFQKVSKNEISEYEFSKK